MTEETNVRARTRYDRKRAAAMREAHKENPELKAKLAELFNICNTQQDEIDALKTEVAALKAKNQELEDRMARYDEHIEMTSHVRQGRV